MEYFILKWIHIVSSTVLFGTGIGLAFHFFIAHVMRDIGAIKFATKSVVLGDWIFTTPAGIIQILSGVLLMNWLQVHLFEQWLFIALLLFVFAGACWVPVVWIQIQMRKMADGATDLSDLGPVYWRYFKIWVALGFLAFPALLAIYWLMIAKPAF